MKLLLIEDDAAIGAVVKRGLQEAHYDVDWVRNGEQGLKSALNEPYAGILLDLMLPDRDGWSVCQELRARRVTTPILMLTARDGVEDRVKGLDTGADDYLPKPFEFTELLARIRALLRRDTVYKGRVLRVGDLEIDTASYQVKRGSREIPLTSREFTLLEALAANAGRVLTRDAIQSRVWSNDESYSNTVDVFIRQLRKKIDQDEPVKLIHTVHGLGYTLRIPEEEE